MWFSNRRAKFRREEKLRLQKREIGGAANYVGGAAAGNGATSATNNMLGSAGSGLVGAAVGTASSGSVGAGAAAPAGGSGVTAGGALGLLQSGGFPSPLAAYGSFAYGLPSASTAPNVAANSLGEGFGCAVHNSLFTYFKSL